MVYKGPHRASHDWSYARVRAHSVAVFVGAEITKKWNTKISQHKLPSQKGPSIFEVCLDAAHMRWNPSVRLPGAKRSAGETFNESFERLFASRM
eukprot:4018717-Amphidinium_carterae.1